MVGQLLNHYRITRPLGSGGMGEVYLADDTRLKRSVAIKILPATLAAQPDRRERFEREAQAVAALNHPNIVTVYSVEQAGDTHFLTMEYVDGRTLADLLPKGGLTLRRLLAIARQIVDAVIAAHEHGIIHRDLKPANVMVTANDRVKVLDFGLAKLREVAEAATSASMPTRELTGEGKIVGTVAYMSPEQAEGKTVDDRSDIFSLGVILYEIATGARPFSGDTSLSVLTSILRDTPKSVTDLNPALPRDLARIVRHCLAKEPDRRYQSAKDLRNELDELEQSLDSGELSAAAPTGGERRRVWPIAAAAGATVAAIGIVAAVWLRTSAGRPANAPPTAVHTRLTQAAGVEQFPSISPDGKWVVYSRDGDIFLQSATGQTAINLTNDAQAANTMPAFSPDGELIAFRSGRDGGIFVMGRTGESARRLTPNGFYPSWFPDGRQIIYSTEGPPGPENRTAFSDLWVVGVTGAEPRRLVPGDAVQPRVSPHGRRIAYWGMPSNPVTKRFVGSASGSNRDIWTVDANGRNPVRATTHDANDWNPVWSPDGAWLYFLSNRAGSMNLWRVAIDEMSGVTRGEPQALTAPAQYVAHFSLSADGRTGAYASIINTSNIGRVSWDSRPGAVTGSLTAVTTGTHDFAYIDVSPDARFIAATTSSRTREDLYVVSVADGRLRQLTNDFARDRAPRWARDGRGIFFYSDRARVYALWRIEADGSGLRQLTTGDERYYPVPTRDGLHVAAADLNTRQLYVYDANDFSKPPEALPPFPDPIPTAYPMPTEWSPDGRSLLITSVGGGSLWQYSRDTRTYRRLVDLAADFASGPVVGRGAWLGDGRRIVYANRGRLFITDVASPSGREILAAPGESLAYPRVSADGSQLFFLKGTSDGDVWTVRFGDQK